MPKAALAVAAISAGILLAGISISYDYMEEALAHILDPFTLTPIGSLTDDGTTSMEDPSAVELFAIRGIPYAFVTAYDGDSLTIINMSNPASPKVAGQIVHGGGVELDGAIGLDLYIHGNNLYAAVTSHEGNSVEIIRVTNPASPVATDSITDGGNRELGGAADIDVFEQDGKPYAAVAANTDDGVQILNLTDPSDVQAVDQITDNGSTTLLDAPHYIKVFNSPGGLTYAAVAAHGSHALQILNLTDLDDITPVDNMVDNSTLVLRAPTGLDIEVDDVNIYAYVASAEEDGIQMFDITNQSNIVALGSITHAENTGSTTSVLDNPNGIRYFTNVVGKDYLAVTSYGGDGIQILNVTDKHRHSPEPPTLGGIVDTGATKLDDPYDVASYVSGNNQYMVVVSEGDDAIQILRLDSSTTTNVAPVVYAGANQTVNSGASVTLGTDAIVVDGNSDPLTYYWDTDFGGNDPHNIADTIPTDKTSLVTTFTVPSAPDPYTIGFKLQVTDHHLAAGTGYVYVHVLGNQPPDVNAGPDQIIPEGSLVTLEGTASDPENHLPLTALWTYGAEGPAPAITIPNTAALRTTFTAPAVTANTTYAFELYVTDSHGGVGTDSMLVTVYDVPSPPPIVNVGGNKRVDEGTTVTLNATATEPDGEAMTFSWSCRDDAGSTINLGNTNSLSVTFTAPDVGHNGNTYTCTFTATDIHGATGTARLILTVRNVPDDGPRMSMIGDTRPTVVVGSSYVDPGAACTTIRDHSISLPVRTTGSVNTDSVGTYEIKYTCEYADRSMSHTRIVKVIQSNQDKDPKVTVTYKRGAIGSDALNADYSSDAVCRDREDGDISHKITTSVSAPIFHSGRNISTITYSCTDSGGNTVPATQRVAVIDGNSPPTISLHGGSIHINVGDSWSDPGATCKDAEDGTWTIKAFKNTIDTTTPGNYLMLYRCLDSDGDEQLNGGVRHVYVTNKDLPPTLTLSSYQQTISVNGTWSMPTATCMDKEDGDISSLVTTYGANSINVHKAGTYKMTFICEDSVGNFVDEFFRVIVTE